MQIWSYVKVNNLVRHLVAAIFLSGINLLNSLFILSQELGDKLLLTT